MDRSDGSGQCICVMLTQSCLTLCHPLDCSSSGFSVNGIFLARILEWVSIFLLQGICLTQGSNQGLLSLALQADSLSAEQWPDQCNLLTCTLEPDYRLTRKQLNCS